MKKNLNHLTKICAGVIASYYLFVVSLIIAYLGLSMKNVLLSLIVTIVLACGSTIFLISIFFFLILKLKFKTIFKFCNYLFLSILVFLLLALFFYLFFLSLNLEIFFYVLNFSILLIIFLYSAFFFVSQNLQINIINKFFTFQKIFIAFWEEQIVQFLIFYYVTGFIFSFFNSSEVEFFFLRFHLVYFFLIFIVYHCYMNFIFFNKFFENFLPILFGMNFMVCNFVLVLGLIGLFIIVKNAFLRKLFLCLVIGFFIFSTPALAQEGDGVPVRGGSKGALLINFAEKATAKELFGYESLDNTKYQKNCQRLIDLYDNIVKPKNNKCHFEICQKARAWQEVVIKSLNSENLANTLKQQARSNNLNAMVIYTPRILFYNPIESFPPFLPEGAGGDAFIRDGKIIIPIEFKYRWHEFNNHDGVENYFREHILIYDNRMPIVLDCDSKTIFRKVLEFVKDTSHSPSLSLLELVAVPNKPEFSHIFVRDASILHEPATDADRLVYKQSLAVLKNIDLDACLQYKKAVRLEIENAQWVNGYHKHPDFKCAISDY